MNKIIESAINFVVKISLVRLQFIVKATTKKGSDNVRKLNYAIHVAAKLLCKEYYLSTSILVSDL